MSSEGSCCSSSFGPAIDGIFAFWSFSNTMRGATALRWSLLVACACANARRRPTLFVRLGESGGRRRARRRAGAATDDAATALVVVAQDANGGDGAAIVAGAVRALPRLRRLFVAFDDGGSRARARDAARRRPRTRGGRRRTPRCALARVFGRGGRRGRAPCLDVVPLPRVPAGARARRRRTARAAATSRCSASTRSSSGRAARATTRGARRERAPRRGGAPAAPLVAVEPAPRSVARAPPRRRRARGRRPTTRRRASLRRRRSAALSTGSTPDTGCCSPRARS